MSTNDELIPSAGARLRQTREHACLNLAVVAKTLNVNTAVLEALENDDFEYFSAPVFARGHLKKYATYLSLPVEELLSAYDEISNTPAQPTLIPPMKLPTPSHFDGLLKWGLGILLMGVLVTGVVFFFVHGPMKWFDTEHPSAPAEKSPPAPLPPIHEQVRPDQQNTEVPVAVLPPDPAKAER